MLKFIFVLHLPFSYYVKMVAPNPWLTASVPIISIIGGESVGTQHVYLAALLLVC